MSIVEQGMLDLNKYRVKEGKRLKQVIKEYINSILKITKELTQLEKKRKSRKKKKLSDQIKSIANDIAYSSTRLESEMIYYFEKHGFTVGGNFVTSPYLSTTVLTHAQQNFPIITFSKFLKYYIIVGLIG